MDGFGGDYVRVIGVTGGIGTGKSTVCKMLETEGGYVVSADEISHKILEPGGVAYDEVFDTFGTVDRVELAKVVFADEGALKKLNKITHKHIAAEILSEISTVKAREDGRYKFIVLEVPLPVKEGFLEVADYVVAVGADEEIRVRRLCQQRGFDEESARARIANQPMPDVYAAIADVVIDNNEDDLQSLLKVIKGVI